MNESPGSSHERRRNSNLRWIICGLLFLAATVNYADRQVIGILKPTLQLQLHWSEVDYGHIIAAFQFAYALGYLLVGRLMDRTGSYRGFSFAVVFWSLAEMAHAFARSVTGFGIARSALALGEGGSFPASMKTVAEWFPENERALATGIFNAGTNIGAVVAPLTVPLDHHAIRLAMGVPGHGRDRLCLGRALAGGVWLGREARASLRIRRYTRLLSRERSAGAGLVAAHPRRLMGPTAHSQTSLGHRHWRVPHRPRLVPLSVLDP